MARTEAKKAASIESLKGFIRTRGASFLGDANVTSIGIGRKIKDNKRTDELCVQFTVREKASGVGLEALDTVELPSYFEIDGIKVATDVIARDYGSSASLVDLEAENQAVSRRKRRLDPIVPGVSMAHIDGTAGTAGCMVYDAATGMPYVLSNWHVLHGPSGDIGDSIVQPGRFDDSRVQDNVAGRLVRSHLGHAGDCAIAQITNRRFDAEIMDLNVRVESIGEPELDDRVIKSGRTTKVTYGIVERVHVISNINYGAAGVRQIGCFEIGPDPKNPAHDGEISMGGDSGSCWMQVAADGSATSMMLGLHFAGEVGHAPEQALACYPASVFKKLNIRPVRPQEVNLHFEASGGFNTGFLRKPVAFPEPEAEAVARDLLVHNAANIFHYTHFSLAMSVERKLAAWVAWNIDGARIRFESRSGIRFRKDPNLPRDAQIGEELYADNPLDRGHIARRAELVWGTPEEADKANRDSFFFTNIAPQHARFNQSRQGGIWGKLENGIFEEAKVEDLRVSVIAGPVFTDNDPLYRGVALPKSFWKVIYYTEEGNSELQARAYVLTQRDLLNRLEVLELPDFEVFEVPFEDLSEMTGFKFTTSGLARCQPCDSSVTESVGGSAIRRVTSERDILFARH